MTDQLAEINWKDLPLLRELYNPKTSMSYTAYVAIDTYIRWIQQDPDIKHLKFYCLNGDFSRGTFVVIDRATAYADTFNESDDELIHLLLLIDYSKGYFFVCLNDRSGDIVRQVLKPKEKTADFVVKAPEGIELRPITKRSDFEKAFSVWPGKPLASVEFFIRQAKYCPSVGAFEKDGTLVAWVFRFAPGLLLALQTDENHYGHVYGSLVVKEISKQVAELGHDLNAGINVENVASRTLFGKLGYEPIGRVQ